MEKNKLKRSEIGRYGVGVGSVQRRGSKTMWVQLLTFGLQEGIAPSQSVSGDCCAGEH